MYIQAHFFTLITSVLFVDMQAIAKLQIQTNENHRFKKIWKGLICFILYNQDLKEPRAFNRQNHNLLITKVNDMGVPGWLLKVEIGFLEGRELIVT